MLQNNTYNKKVNSTVYCKFKEHDKRPIYLRTQLWSEAGQYSPKAHTLNIGKHMEYHINGQITPSTYGHVNAVTCYCSETEAKTVVDKQSQICVIYYRFVYNLLIVFVKKT